MCYCVYIGVERPLVLTETNAHRAVFYLEEVSAEEKAVEQHFSKKHVYYAGSHSGCSCGLFCQPDEPPEAKAAAKAFLQCISQVLQHAQSVELYTCWVGNQYQVPRERLENDLADIDVDANGFDLEEEVFLTLIPKS